MSEVPRIAPELAPSTTSDARSLTRFHERLLAEELTTRLGDSSTRVVRALSDARVDLNPHQLEAAVFAIDALTRSRWFTRRR